MKSSVRKYLIWVWAASLWSAGCGEKARLFEVSFHRHSEGQFISSVIDLGENREVAQWGNLSLDFDTGDRSRTVDTEYCLTNNDSPKLGNYFTYTRSPMRLGVFNDFPNLKVVTSDPDAPLPLYFSWGNQWESAKYWVLFDFKQAFSFTRVVAAVVSHYPNQHLPHILVYAGESEEGEFRQVGEGFLPADAREKLENKQGYGGNYEIPANLPPSAARARFLKIVFDKPQIGIDTVILQYLRVWGKVKNVSQLFTSQFKAVSAATAEDIAGPVETVFKGVSWVDSGMPIPCPENRFVRFLVRVEPIYDVALPAGSVSGKFTPVLL